MLHLVILFTEFKYTVSCEKHYCTSEADFKKHRPRDELRIWLSIHSLTLADTLSTVIYDCLPKSAALVFFYAIDLIDKLFNDNFCLNERVAVGHGLEVTVYVNKYLEATPDFLR